MGKSKFWKCDVAKIGLIYTKSFRWMALVVNVVKRFIFVTSEQTINQGIIVPGDTFLPSLIFESKPTGSFQVLHSGELRPYSRILDNAVQLVCSGRQWRRKVFQHLQRGLYYKNYRS
jgi:hypothetical protein